MSVLHSDSPLDVSKVWAVVPAAGSSSRMRRSLAESGGGTPGESVAGRFTSKIFLELSEGRSVLHESLKRLSGAGIRNLCISTQRELIEDVRKVAKEVTVWERLEVIEGGETRFHSVKKALTEIVSDEPSVVTVHDAARPFASSELIKESVKKAVSGIAVILANPVTSTIKLVPDGRIISGTPDRKTLWEAQTPQTFPFAPLYEAFLKITESDELLYDDASVFEKAGGIVEVLESPPENIKVTSLRDLSLAKILYAERR